MIVHAEDSVCFEDTSVLGTPDDDVRLRAGSPSIDAGDPSMPMGQEPLPNGGRINPAAYGGTSQASKSTNGGRPAMLHGRFGIMRGEP